MTINNREELRRDLFSDVFDTFRNMKAQTDSLDSQAHRLVDRIMAHQDYHGQASSKGHEGLVEAMNKKVVTIRYCDAFLNEQSDAMKGQTQTTKQAREVFEQYRATGFDPEWKIDDAMPPRFIGIALHYALKQAEAGK